MGAVVARHIGPESFGVITFSLTVASTLQALASLGIEGVLIRKVEETRNISSTYYDSEHSKPELNIEKKVQRLITSALFIRLFSGAFVFVIANVYLIIVLELTNEAKLISFFVTSSLIFQAGDVIDLFNQGELKGHKTAISKIFSYIVINVLRWFLLKLNASLVFFAATYFLEFFLIFVLLMFLHKMRYTFYLDYQHMFYSLKEFIQETWPIIAAGFLAAITTRIDQIFVATLMSPEKFGLYSAAIVIGSAPHFIPGIICGSLISTASRFKITDEALYKKLIFSTYIVNSLISIFIIMVLYHFASQIIIYMYGEDFSISSDYLKWYGVLNLPVFIGVTHSIWMITEKKMTYLLIKSAASSILATSISLSLIPVYGVMGAIFSLLISTFFAEIIFPMIYWMILLRKGRI